MTSRSSRRRTLPAGLSGNASTSSKRSGSLNFAMPRASRKSFSASKSSCAPGLGMTKAQAFSPNTRSGIATTQTFCTAGWATMWFSTSSVLTFSPPRLIRSLIRPSR